MKRLRLAGPEGKGGVGAGGRWGSVASTVSSGAVQEKRQTKVTSHCVSYKRALLMKLEIQSGFPGHKCRLRLTHKQTAQY